MERGTVSMRVALCYDLLRFSLCSWICVMTYGVVNSILWCCYQSSPLKKQSITPQIPLLSDSGLAKSNENIGLVTEQLTVVRCVVGIEMPTSYCHARTSGSPWFAFAVFNFSSSRAISLMTLNIRVSDAVRRHVPGRHFIKDEGSGMTCDLWLSYPCVRSQHVTISI